MATRFPKFSQDLAQDPTTRRIWYGIATAHDFESHDGMTEEALYQKLFATHFGHLAIIFLWSSGNLFHIAWQGNFEQWVSNPTGVVPIAHAIWDPHFGKGAVEAFTPEGGAGPVNAAYSGLYYLYYTLGMRFNSDLYQGSIFLMVLATIFLIAGWLHLQPRFRPSLAWFKNAESRLNHHLSALFGVSSLAFAGHMIHVAIPAARGQRVDWSNFLNTLPHPAGLAPFFTGNWGVYADPEAGPPILTFIGGLNPATGTLWLTDIAHHHLAIAVIFIIAGHMYRTNFGIGHSIKEILDAHKGPLTGEGHRGLYDTINNSLHFQLGLALASLGVVTSLVAQHTYALPAYFYMPQDHTTMAALYTHHQYIAGFLMVGAFAHGAIFFVRDYDPKANENNVLARMLEHKEALISHLSWVSLFLGFHTLGLYVHNDVMLAFGRPEDQLLIEPVFAQFVQVQSGKIIEGIPALFGGPGVTAPGEFLTGWLGSVNANNSPIFLPIGPGDFLVHHAIALGLHTTTLILVKGALDARGSKLMPDKKDFGFAFPCDGPGRGGTCDISAWDAFYLAVFWMLNTIGWVTFYWHWKWISIWGDNVAQFNASSTYLMGWLRDYLWANSAPLIGGYSPSGGTNALSVWAWMFLFGHLVWATGFMFLIAWRGYWQELIETLVWAHERTPLANLVRWKDKPVAMSIVQGRLVGLAHFTIGYILTYAAFLIASTAALYPNGPAAFTPAISAEQAKGVLSEFKAKPVPGGVMLLLPENIVFDFDKSNVKLDADPALNRVAGVIQFYGSEPVEILGHTDSLGEDAYNQKLSEDRANAVKAFFEKKGIEADRLTAKGYGETKPVAPNAKPDGSDNPEGRQQNRRVEILIKTEVVPVS
ncbi:MAG: photosystem I core protein PsaB [Aphanocapsa lilacina HA4352-LM1]|jgi:photosystem I P700 chlorophyll a apoprotein A2|nr:photosystem I core protein PsaB [Aphanocapsa lilacina HA4352-LM1]